MTIDYNCDPCTDKACENLILTDDKLYRRFIARILCSIKSLLGGGGPSGYATETTVQTINGKIAVCNTSNVTISTMPAVAVSSMPPVTVTIPPGGATAANQVAGNASLTSIDGKITACDTTDVTITSMPAIPAAYWALRMDEGATYTYVGEAVPGTLDAAASWRIKRITNASGSIVWADGNSSSDNIWNNRAALAYS